MAEGDTYHSGPFAGEGFRTFDLDAKAFAGDSLHHNEAVRIGISVFEYPGGQPVGDPVERTLRSGETCPIPGLPWRAKFEYFEDVDGRRQAVICVIRDTGD